MVRSLALAQGEDLRAIALRELGDPARWIEIAEINGLRLPFVVHSWRQEDRLPGTLIWGDEYLVPAHSQREVYQSTSLVFGRDVRLINGQLDVEKGDLSVVAGVDCVRQAMSNRIKTLRGELVYHSRYGSHVRLALGLPKGPFAALAASGWVHETLAEEPRVRTIEAVDGKSRGDVIEVAARVLLERENTPIDINLVLNA